MVFITNRMRVVTGMLAVMTAIFTQAAVEYEGWAYNITNSTGQANLSFNYTKLLNAGHIQDETQLNVYYYNFGTSSWVAVQGQLNTVLNLVIFQDSGNRIYRLGETTQNPHEDTCTGCTVQNNQLLKYVEDGHDIEEIPAGNGAIW